LHTILLTGKPIPETLRRPSNEALLGMI